MVPDAQRRALHKATWLPCFGYFGKIVRWCPTPDCRRPLPQRILGRPSNFTTISLLSNFFVANLQESLKTFDVLHRDHIKHHVTKRSIDNGSRPHERVLEFTTLGRYRRLLKGTGDRVQAMLCVMEDLNIVWSNESRAV